VDILNLTVEKIPYNIEAAAAAVVVQIIPPVHFSLLYKYGNRSQVIQKIILAP
jgi:hypothetical protein